MCRITYRNPLQSTRIIKLLRVIVAETVNCPFISLVVLPLSIHVGTGTEISYGIVLNGFGFPYSEPFSSYHSSLGKPSPLTSCITHTMPGSFDESKAFPLMENHNRLCFRYCGRILLQYILPNLREKHIVHYQDVLCVSTGCFVRAFPIETCCIRFVYKLSRSRNKFIYFIAVNGISGSKGLSRPLHNISPEY